MRAIDRLEAWGHPSITATNRMTFEFTKESHLTLQGDCIVGVRADRGAKDLSQEFKALAKNPSAVITVEMAVDEMKIVVEGQGSPALSFFHPMDLVGRRSSYTCSRTLMVKANLTAKDFPRELVEAMRNPQQRAKVIMAVEV